MKEEEFIKLTKKQKLEIQFADAYDGVECSRVLFIPLLKKMDGYGSSACFIFTTRGWLRMRDYDCFRFYLEGNSKYTHLKGDFEHGGIVFFTPDATFSYGNDFRIYCQK